jgi:hypothetical protein
MLAGVLAAMLATLFARVMAEPQIDIAIGYEAAHAHHVAGAMEDVELVSRDVQKGIGLLTALSLYGAAVGGIFSLVFAYGYGRFARIGPRSFALVLAGLAFVIVVLVPSLKYPQTPPAVGQHETVGFRTAAYFGMIALSVIAAIVAVQTRKAFARSLGGIDATLAAIAAYIALVMLVQITLPAIDEVPADFPATLLWQFRVGSMATQALLWATIGIAFGRSAEHVLSR